MDPIGSVLILDILDVLQKHSDVDHGISQKDIIDILERDYGYENLQKRRLTVKRNLEKLINYHELRNINEITMTTNTRKEKDRLTGEIKEIEVHSDFVYIHDFTHEELQLIIDSIIFSKQIPNAQREYLIGNIEKLASKHFVSRVGRVQTMSNNEPMNKQLFNTIRVLNEAISENKKVSFYYNQYVIDYQSNLAMQARTDREGNPRQYIISPYQLVAANGRYYVICNNKKYDNLSHYRVDRILDIQQLHEKRKSFVEMSHVKQLDLSEYMREHIYMFAGDTAKVKIRFNKRLLNEFIDWFGTVGLQFSDQTEDEVIVTVRVNRTAMRKWALQYGIHVRVLSPDDLVEEIKKDIQTAWKNYE